MSVNGWVEEMCGRFGRRVDPRPTAVHFRGSDRGLTLRLTVLR